MESVIDDELVILLLIPLPSLQYHLISISIISIPISTTTIHLHPTIQIQNPPLPAPIPQNRTNQPPLPPPNDQFHRSETLLSCEDVLEFFRLQRLLVSLREGVFGDLGRAFEGFEEGEVGGVVGVGDPFRVEEVAFRWEGVRGLGKGRGWGGAFGWTSRGGGFVGDVQDVQVGFGAGLEGEEGGRA